MHRPPRPRNENLFAGGGLACTLLYGFLIALISTAAFLQLPVSLLLSRELPLTPSHLRLLLKSPELLTRCQTYAFTVLGISQLFHAIGMRDVETSIFRIPPFTNGLMVTAFCIGISLQVLVTEIPCFVTAFGTCRLSIAEWGRLILLSATPLLAHEFLLFRTPFKTALSQPEAAEAHR